MKWLKELIAAMLVLSSIAVSYARSDEAVPAPACISYETFIDRIKPNTPFLELTGQKLTEFNERYKLKYNDDPPDADKVAFFSDGDNETPVSYVVVFKDNCIVSMGTVDRQKIMELENGLGL